MAARPLPEIPLLSECFDYEPDSGILRWRERPQSYFANYKSFRTGNGRFAGAIAGRCDTYGYIQVSVSGQRILAHRVIWAMRYGKYPESEIDHINGNRSDNRLVNLRLANRFNNCCNRSGNKTNVTGLKGVSWASSPQKWQARISAGNQQFYLGIFETPEDAHAAYCKAAHQLHGKFARSA